MHLYIIDIVCSGQEDSSVQLPKLRSKVAVFLLMFGHFKLRYISKYILYPKDPKDVSAHPKTGVPEQQDESPSGIMPIFLH